jgi:hypothetical protein
MLNQIRLYFFFVNNLLLSNSELIGDIYNNHKNGEDSFLHIVYAAENTFG